MTEADKLFERVTQVLFKHIEDAPEDGRHQAVVEAMAASIAAVEVLHLGACDKDFCPKQAAVVLTRVLLSQLTGPAGVLAKQGKQRFVQ